MTTYLDYSAVPAENISPPPVGAPENHPTNQVNNIMREIMSVIRQLGDGFQTEIDALGTMAVQDADAVAITGGTIAGVTVSGDGAGLTNLAADELVGGPIPSAIFPADATPLDVKVARAAVADSLTAAGSLALLPIGTIVMWYGLAVPVGWHLCDGTAGTPDLRGRFPRGCGAGETPGTIDPATGNMTDAAGAHDHGAATGNHVLTVAQLPSHQHRMVEASNDDVGPYKEVIGGSGTAWQPMGGDPGNWALPTGDNQPHNHTVANVADHQHTLPVIVPPNVGLHFIMRVS